MAAKVGIEGTGPGLGRQQLKTSSLMLGSLARVFLFGMGEGKPGHDPPRLHEPGASSRSSSCSKSSLCNSTKLLQHAAQCLQSISKPAKTVSVDESPQISGPR